MIRVRLKRINFDGTVEISTFASGQISLLEQIGYIVKWEKENDHETIKERTAQFHFQAPVGRLATTDYSTVSQWAILNDPEILFSGEQYQSSWSRYDVPPPRKIYKKFQSEITVQFHKRGTK